MQRVFLAISHHNLVKAPSAIGAFTLLAISHRNLVKSSYLEFTSTYAITAIACSTEGVPMNQRTILSVGKSYQSPCPTCKKVLSIGGGPSVGGYRYQAHHSPPTEKSLSGQACPDSGSLVKEDELVRLASLWT
jgi:hypothetical protein